MRPKNPWKSNLTQADLEYFVESHPLHAALVVEAAVLGWRKADNILRKMICRKLKRGEPLGAVLGAYSIRLLAITRRQP